MSHRIRVALTFTCGALLLAALYVGFVDPVHDATGDPCGTVFSPEVDAVGCNLARSDQRKAVFLILAGAVVVGGAAMPTRRKKSSVSRTNPA